jgi:glycosyltransferase involved in cell wall biosynthesis
MSPSVFVNPRVTVAICTWNRCDLLRQTLEALTRLRVPTQLTWELLVVNNASTDATDQVIAEFAGRLPIRGTHESQAGLSHARNRALRESRSDLLLFTDDDVIVDENWLTEFVDAATRNPQAAAFGGPIEPWFPSRIDPVYLQAFPIVASGFCGIDHGSNERFLKHDEDVYGACMGFRRSQMRGLTFDPELGCLRDSGRVGEEVDLLARLRDAGGRVLWVPTMKLRHYVDPGRATLPYLRRYHDQKGQLWVRSLGVPEGAQVLGAPRWLWRKAAEAQLRSVWYAVTRRRVPSLEQRRRYWWLKGMIKGCRNYYSLKGPSASHA